MKISTFAWLTVLLPAFCLDLFADDTPTAVQVFNARYGKTAQETIQKRREFYRQKPDDWRTRYYLATVLIKQAQSESELSFTPSYPATHSYGCDRCALLNARFLN
jgi:hypothetical protein